MRFSIVFIVLAIIALLCFALWFLGSEGSGAGVAAIIFAGLFVLVALYNRFHNGTWFTDFSGGK